MVRRPPRLVCIFIVALTFPGAAWSEEEKLIPMQAETVRDDMGFSWKLIKQGWLNATEDFFSKGCRLKVNGKTFGDSELMTPAREVADPRERELVIKHELGDLSVARRVRLYPEKGLMRFAEVIENRGDAPASVELQVRTELEGEAITFLGEEGAEYTGPSGTGAALVAVTAIGSKPSVILIFCDPRAKVKPEVAVEGNRNVTAIYRFELKARSTGAVVHYAAQSPDGLSANARQLLKQLVGSGRIMDDRLPTVVRGRIVNFSESATGALVSAPPLEELDAALDALRVGRGTRDVAVVDSETRLTGTITGSDLEVATAFGAAKVPFHDVAAIIGGAGVQQVPRVFLRNGEVLVGTVTGGEMAMTTETGLKLRPRVEEVGAVAMRTGPKDGETSAGVAAFLSTHRGDCLAIADKSGFRIAATTPWGAVRVPLSQVHGLSYVRQPFPSHRFVLLDGSRFVAMLAADPWSIETARFGLVKVVPQGVREVRAIAVKSDSAPPGELGATFAEVVGNCRLRGRIDLPELHLATTHGVTPVATDSILKLTCLEAEDGAAPEVRIEQAGDRTLRGKLEERVLPLREVDMVWRVPLVHLESYTVSLPAPVEASPSPDPSPTPAAP